LELSDERSPHDCGPFIGSYEIRQDFLTPFDGIERGWKPD